MKLKTRIDKLVFDRGFASSQEHARGYIMAGKVLVNEQKIDKPGTKFPDNVTIRVMGEEQPFVSRGGLKLKKALLSFDIDVQNKIVMDVGASTGGFTDCLLQNGASYVFAVDTGFNQLAWKLVNDHRVRNLEKSNFRYLELKDIGSFVDLIVIDVSFISLTKILPNCWNFLIKGGDIIALIKPQFEAGKKDIQKGGIVTDSEIRQQIIESIKEQSKNWGYLPQKVDSSPIQGKKSGNEEFLLHLIKPGS